MKSVKQGEIKCSYCRVNAAETKSSLWPGKLHCNKPAWSLVVLGFLLFNRDMPEAILQAGGNWVIIICVGQEAILCQRRLWSTLSSSAQIKTWRTVRSASFSWLPDGRHTLHIAVAVKVLPDYSKNCAHLNKRNKKGESSFYLQLKQSQKE